MWLLLKRSKHSNQLTGCDGEKGSIGVSSSTSDSTGGYPADVLSALSSLVCVSQRACDASHWRFKRDADACDDTLTLLLADKLLLLGVKICNLYCGVNACRNRYDENICLSVVRAFVWRPLLNVSDFFLFSYCTSRVQSTSSRNTEILKYLSSEHQRLLPPYFGR